MADISYMEVNGVTYSLKDAEGRSTDSTLQDQIDSLQSAVDNIDGGTLT